MVDLGTPLYPLERYTMYDLIPYLENKMLVLHNATFDLGFFYKYNFFPKPGNVRDTMIAYRILYNGLIYTSSFKEVMGKELNVFYDKTEQANISKVKLSQDSTIQYSFNDVDRLLELEEKMFSKIIERGQEDVYLLNCNFLRALAYYEQCGLPFDSSLWTIKVEEDKKEQKEKAQKVIDYIFDNAPKYRENQLSLFGDDLKKVIVKLSSNTQMIPVFKHFNINVLSDEGKESIDKKVINKSDHEFIKIWLDFQDINHDVSTYGQNILDKNINERIYTRYNPMVDTGRISTRKEGINFLNFPSNEKTNRCFRSVKGSYSISCDYASQENRTLAVLTQDENSILNVVNDRDAHSLLARKVYPEIADLTDEEIKKKHSDKRQEGKISNFTINYISL